MKSERHPLRAFALVSAIFISFLGLSACGGSDKANGKHNQADIAFVQHMLPHHMHGVEMATLAAQKGATSQVKDLGRRIAAKQKQEIALMQGYLKTWGAKTGPPAPAVKMSAEEAQLAKLKADTGAKFDRDFLMFMMDHHLSAIDMAQIEQTSGQDGSGKALATSIIATQEAKAKEMQQLLASGV